MMWNFRRAAEPTAAVATASLALPRFRSVQGPKDRQRLLPVYVPHRRQRLDYRCSQCLGGRKGDGLEAMEVGLLPTRQVLRFRKFSTGKPLGPSAARTLPVELAGTPNCARFDHNRGHKPT
jgi:hypothetical protein